MNVGRLMNIARSLLIDGQSKLVLTEMNNAPAEPRAGSHHSAYWFFLSERLIHKRPISSVKVFAELTCVSILMPINNSNVIQF